LVPPANIELGLNPKHKKTTLKGSARLLKLVYGLLRSKSRLIRSRNKRKRRGRKQRKGRPRRKKLDLQHSEQSLRLQRRENGNFSCNLKILEILPLTTMTVQTRSLLKRVHQQQASFLEALQSLRHHLWLLRHRRNLLQAVDMNPLRSPAPRQRNLEIPISKSCHSRPRMGDRLSPHHRYLKHNHSHPHPHLHSQLICLRPILSTE